MRRTGQHSECLGHTLKLMRIKSAGRRCQRAERNNYHNCAGSLCLSSMTFFGNVAKQVEHNLKIVRYKDQRGKKKKKTQQNETKQQRGNKAHWWHWGHWFHRAAAWLQNRCTSTCRIPGRNAGRVMQTRFRHTSAAIKVSEFEPHVWQRRSKVAVLPGGLAHINGRAMRENSRKAHL